MIRSNRDFYLHVSELQGRPGAARPLDAFLVALARSAAPHAAQATIDIALFAAWIERALDLPVAPGHHFGGPQAGPPGHHFGGPQAGPPGDDLPDLPRGAHPDYASAWHPLLVTQVKDVREMAAAGTLDDPMAYFGINAPSGNRWYNLNPAQYIECATCGTFGGWEPGDETGRDFVPGPCVATDASGALVTVSPESIERPVESVAPLGWRDLATFLSMGQHYE